MITGQRLGKNGKRGSAACAAVLLLSPASALAAVDPEVAEARAELARSAVPAGAIVHGDGWTFRVPARGRWRLIEYGGNQTACRGLAEISLDEASSLPTELTICPRVRPAGEAPARAIMAALEAEIRGYAAQDRMRIKDLVQADATVGDRAIRRMTYRIGASVLGLPGTSGWAHYVVFCPAGRAPESPCFVFDEGSFGKAPKAGTPSLLDDLVRTFALDSAPTAD